MKLHIQGAHLVDPANGVNGVSDLYIQNRKVAALGAKPKGFTADKSIAADGLYLFPGLIDLCVRLREPVAQSSTASIASETRAAARAGITRIVCPPDPSLVLDTPDMVHTLRARAAHTGFSHIHPLGALTVGLAGKRLSNMALLMDAGCVGVSNGLCGVEDTLVMRRALQYAATYGLRVFLTPCDLRLQGNGVVHEGEVSARLGLPAIPEAAETVGVARDLALIETSGVRAHFDSLSSARSVEMLVEAQARKLAVSASVAVHHLHLSEQHIRDFDSRYKVLPPLRTERDRHGLRQGVQSGAISVLTSHHQPYDLDAKLVPFVDAPAGISGLDTLLPLSMALVDERVLDLNTVIAALTTNPANLIGVDAGHLGVGAEADFCLFDPAKEWRLDEQSMHSAGKNSPWLRQTLRGKVVATAIGGKLVHGKAL